MYIIVSVLYPNGCSTFLVGLVLAFWGHYDMPGMPGMDSWSWTHGRKGLVIKEKEKD